MSTVKGAFVRAISGLNQRQYSSLFSISERTKALKRISREFAERELAPTASEHDRLATFPRTEIEKVSQKGWMGICIKETYGGAGYDLLSACVVLEELARCCASIGIIASIHNCLYAELVQRYGTLAQIDEFLRPYTNEQIGAFALSEQNAGSDAANLSTLATSDGSDFVLNGRKAWITSAHEAKAAIIFARANKNDAQRGITAFLVDMHAPGVRLSSKEEKLGIRATSTSDIILEQVRVPRGNVIGEIGEGFKIAMSQMQLGRIGVASQALGIGQAALDLAIQYACERKTFGYPLIDKQLVKSKIAKMAIDLESARLLTWKAASLRDNGEDFRKISSMAKYAASRCASANANDCIQILGAKGFISGLAERYYRDARVTQIYGGATDIQKMIVADMVVKELKNNEFS